MLRQYLKQIKYILKSSPLFSTISILATALTITFVMVLFMIYSFKTNDIAPESNRSRVLYSTKGYSYRTENHSNANTGMSYKAAKSIFGELQNGDVVSYSALKGEGAALVGTSTSNSDKRIISLVDENYFKIFQLHFIRGGAFNSEQVDATRKDAIITDRLALKLFNTTDAIGKEININFIPYRITGVVKSFSPLFNKAYSDVWCVVEKENLTWMASYCEGLVGNTQVMVLCKEGVSISKLEKEIEERIKSFNELLQDFTFEVGVKSHPQESFFQSEHINPIKVFTLLIVIILLVPAINMSGLLSSQMKKRETEVGVRKAYGANSKQIASQLIFENMVLTLIGGVVGVILSSVAILLFKDILLADLMTMNAADGFNLPLSLFFNPAIFLSTLVFSLIINFLSAMVPVWKISKKSIINILKGE